LKGERASKGSAGADERSRWGIEGLALGISLGGATGAAAWQQALHWVDWAERHGLHSVWLPEMHFAPGGSTSPLLCLSAFAARTKRLRLATTSLLLPIHPPLRVASEVAALDHLSQGRVLLGLGRGFRAPLFAAFGIDPATKRDRFDAALDLILAAWRGEGSDRSETDFEASKSEHADADRRPYQTPHPPLAVAAFGRKGLAQAARRGLPYLASPMEPFELIRENLEYHHERIPEPLAPGRQVVPVMRTIFVAQNEMTAARVMAGLESETRRPRASAKLPRAIARAVNAPLAERVVVGSVAQVTDRLALYREALGMNLLVARPQLAGATAAEREASMDLLCGEVLPGLAN
jgi:alkanesulfonate monooxygenase SsuD/methylene tetrahydromethanopterin reductase-like flavin-dependent oxidoreductase (luciferase family)